MQGRRRARALESYSRLTGPRFLDGEWLLETPALVVAALLAAGILTACGRNSGAGTSAVNAPDQSEPPTTALSAPPAVVRAYSSGAPLNPTLVAADNAFGLNVLGALIPNNIGNVTIAPISVAMALQIVYNGAAGPTQQAMAGTLQLDGLATADLNTANAALEASLINPDSQVQITLANSLWMHLADNPVSSSFSQTDTTYYGATIGDLAGAPDDVNTWVSAQTQGVIAQLLPSEPAAYYQRLVALIANVIYFKGQWSQGFDVAQTAATPFTRADGSTVTVEMMNQTGSFGYFQGSNFQVLNLPYGQGRLSMVIILPDAGLDMGAFTAELTVPTLTAWINNLKTQTVAVGLPRFDASFSTSLTPALTSLGMGIAFCTSLQADLSGISPLACLSDVEHKTVVQVDESGTIAAASTGTPVSVTVVASPQATMIINHPFFYSIRDNQTGELLFIGVLRDPAQT